MVQLIMYVVLFSKFPSLQLEHLQVYVYTSMSVNLFYHIPQFCCRRFVVPYKFKNNAMATNLSFKTIKYMYSILFHLAQ